MRESLARTPALLLCSSDLQERSSYRVGAESSPELKARSHSWTNGIVSTRRA